jgi:NDP-mannose synthase
MAGGRSERMRSTAGRTHKALVRVLGLPMIERNLLGLLAQGFRDITVAVNALEHDVRNYVLQRGTTLARMRNASLACYTEELPLGTIGVAGHLQCGSAPLVVINVDNLTTLDLKAFVDHHARTKAALSIATHFEPIRVPFGEVVVQDGHITEYLEKPTFSVHLSSGTYVLSRRARSLIQKDCRTDIPGLFERLRERGERIVAFEHNAPWIDVNDATSLERAERLIEEHSKEFERLQSEDEHR